MRVFQSTDAGVPITQQGREQDCGPLWRELQLMRRKHLLSLFMLSMGVVLLVAAMVATGASSATRSHSAVGGVEQVGVLNAGNPPISYLDPAIAYDTGSWTALNATS